jgi:hypothetical protein
VGADRRGTRAVAEGDPALDGPVRAAVHLGIGFDEEEQGRDMLGRGDSQIAAPAELEPVLVRMADEIVPPGEVLDGLAGVDGDPAPAADSVNGPESSRSY